LKTVRCLYSCTWCELEDAEVDVPARGKAEDVVAWMRRAVIAVGNDHQRRTPGCRAPELRNLKIPVEGVDRIGDPPTQNLVPGAADTDETKGDG
jgi:hypothetical protein